MLTAVKEHREEWEPCSWFVLPERRFICENIAAAPLTLASALLYVAARSVSAVVTVIPARCAIADEEVLRNTLGYAAEDLSNVPEGIASLGMLDLKRD